MRVTPLTLANTCVKLKLIPSGKERMHGQCTGGDDGGALGGKGGWQGDGGGGSDGGGGGTTAAPD